MTDKLSSRRATLRWRRARVKKLVLLLCFLLGGYAYAELMWQLIAKGYPLLYYSTPSLIKSVMAVVFLIYAALPFVAILFLVLSRLEVLRRMSGEQWLSKAKPWVALGGLIVAYEGIGRWTVRSWLCDAAFECGFRTEGIAEFTYYVVFPAVCLVLYLWKRRRTLRRP